ncbi:Hypothetical predicted protein, partial [Pelobates cultripes]
LSVTYILRVICGIWRGIWIFFLSPLCVCALEKEPVWIHDLCFPAGMLIYL